MVSRAQCDHALMPLRRLSRLVRAANGRCHSNLVTDRRAARAHRTRALKILRYLILSLILCNYVTNISDYVFKLDP